MLSRIHWKNCSFNFGDTMSICAICGGQGSLTIVEMITCAKGCCKATINSIGMKIIQGGDPAQCGGAAKHAAVGICAACSFTNTRQLPTEFAEGYQPPVSAAFPPKQATALPTSSVSKNRSNETSRQMRSA